MVLLGTAALLPDGAGPEPVGHVVGLIDVLGEHGRRQTVFSVVGSGHHLLHGLKLQDLHHGTKDLQKHARNRLRI